MKTDSGHIWYSSSSFVMFLITFLLFLVMPAICNRIPPKVLKSRLWKHPEFCGYESEKRETPCFFVLFLHIRQSSGEGAEGLVSTGHGR